MRPASLLRPLFAVLLAAAIALSAGAGAATAASMPDGRGAAAAVAGGSVTTDGAAEGAAERARDLRLAAERARDVRLPAAGEAAVAEVQVRSAPRRDSRRLETMDRLRSDYRPTVFFVFGRERRDDGTWLRIRVPGRPNGQTGWVQAGALRGLRYVGGRELVVDRSRREIRLVKGRRTVLHAPLAVGKPGAPTPLGSFYLTAAFHPSDSFLGPWAFETSAYSALSDWPGGGIVGLHGTSEPSSIGHAASHGCLRVHNDVIMKLKRMVGPGTPLLIKR